MIKNKGNRYVISIVTQLEDEYIVLATDFNRYFIEKGLTHDIIQERLNVS